MAFAVVVGACATSEAALPQTTAASAPLRAEPGGPTTSEAQDTTSSGATVAPSTTEGTTTTTLPPRGRLVVSATGDVNLDPTYIPALAAEGFRLPLERAAADLRGRRPHDRQPRVRRLRTSGRRPSRSSSRSGVDTDALPFMRAAGVEVANLGNNHSGDYGTDALLDSREQLEAAGSLRSASATTPSRLTSRPSSRSTAGRSPCSASAASFRRPTWIATDDRPGMADGDTIETMVAAVAAADEIADLVIVAIHWGVELDTQPRQEDRERAEAMIAAGADAIFGHHAHRLQPLEDGRRRSGGMGSRQLRLANTVDGRVDDGRRPGGLRARRLGTVVPRADLHRVAGPARPPSRARPDEPLLRLSPVPASQRNARPGRRRPAPLMGNHQIECLPHRRWPEPQHRDGGGRSDASPTGGGGPSRRARDGGGRSDASPTGGRGPSRQARDGGGRSDASPTGGGGPSRQARDGGGRSDASPTGGGGPSRQARDGGGRIHAP